MKFNAVTKRVESVLSALSQPKSVEIIIALKINSNKGRNLTIKRHSVVNYAVVK